MREYVQIRDQRQPRPVLAIDFKNAFEKRVRRGADMREELKRGNRSMFSRDLEQALNKTIQRGEQAILFLNRRGQASYVFCRDCGYVVECKRCDTPMTYHRHGEAMRCHHCDNR